MKNFDYLKELPLFTTLYTQCDRAESCCAAHAGGVSKKDCEYAVIDIYYFVGDVLMLLGYIDRYPKFDKSLLPGKGTPVMVLTSIPSVQSNVGMI